MHIHTCMHIQIHSKQIMNLGLPYLGTRSVGAYGDCATNVGAHDVGAYGVGVLNAGAPRVGAPGIGANDASAHIVSAHNFGAHGKTLKYYIITAEY